jgi:hypothetical protein
MKRPGSAAPQGNHRLHRKWEQCEARHKRRVLANVAGAREAAGWCWPLVAPVQREQPWKDESTCAVPGPYGLAAWRKPAIHLGQPEIPGHARHC